jgi:hypothetical protein
VRVGFDVMAVSGAVVHLRACFSADANKTITRVYIVCSHFPFSFFIFHVCSLFKLRTSVRCALVHFQGTSLICLSSGYSEQKDGDQGQMSIGHE